MHLAFWVNLVPILLSLVPGELEVQSWSILIVSLVSCQIFLCAIFFLYLWVQDGHLFEQIYWPFLWELIGTVSNLHLDTGLLQFFQLTKGNCFVITQWTKAWAINRLKGFMLACGSQPWVQKCTQPRNQSYIIWPDMIVTLFLYFLFVIVVFLLVFYRIYSLSLLNLSINAFRQLMGFTEKWPMEVCIIPKFERPGLTKPGPMRANVCARMMTFTIN